MSYKRILDNIEKIKKKHSGWIRDIKLSNGKKLFLASKESALDDTTIKIRHDIENDVKEGINKIVCAMRKNKVFRNFMCVNVAAFINKNKSSNDFIEEHDDEEISGLKSVYIIKKLGFIDINAELPAEELLETQTPDVVDFFDELTGYYKEQLDHLNEPSVNVNVIKHIIAPAEKLCKILDLDFISSKKYFKFEITEKFQKILEGIQLHMHYEKYITNIIAEETKCEVVNNPLILINPRAPRGKIIGYIELDGSLIVGKTLMVLECKNSKFVGLREIAGFIGRLEIIKHTYEIEDITAVMVSTGQVNWKFWTRNYKNIFDSDDFPNTYLFPQKDHRKSYKKLRKLCAELV